MKNQEIHCPVCGRADNRPVSRISADLHRCGNCRAVFNSGYLTPDYDDSYFISDYRNQYGKTYIEDFDNIYRLSLSRLDKIARFIKKRDQGTGNLLDIGSAAGFFLKAARDRGFEDLAGIEISRYASEYCVKEFGIKTINSPFEEAALDHAFDVITAWYFIEHSRDPISNIRKIYSILKEGGVFAFSVPSVFGPQFIFSRERWAETHPQDHRVDFSPSSAKKILIETGFKKVKVFPAGFHPERIISHKNIGFSLFKLIYPQIARLLKFSDTIEIYAVK